MVFEEEVVVEDPNVFAVPMDHMQKVEVVPKVLEEVVEVELVPIV